MRNTMVLPHLGQSGGGLSGGDTLCEGGLATDCLTGARVDIWLADGLA